MKIKLLLLIILFNHINSINSTTTFISLGGDCTVATVLRNLGLRKAAYPFDWVFSPTKSLYECIRNDFKDFMHIDGLRVSPKNNKIVLNSYGIKFVHDFPTSFSEASLTDSQTHDWGSIRSDWKNFISLIGAKYQRRISRFIKACKGNDKVIFVLYANYYLDEISKLRNLFLEKYPDLDFTIAIAVGKNGYIPDFELKRVKFARIPYKSGNFIQNWKNFLNDKVGAKALKNNFVMQYEDGDFCDGTCCVLHNVNRM